MVFSSAIFLFLFLPLVLFSHWLVGRCFRNILLLFASLFFYAWGEGLYVVVMLLSILVNYIFARMLDANIWQQRRKLLVTIMLVINLLPLLYFKYSVFLLTNINAILSVNKQLNVPDEVHLPIGISFFTFQAMSYLIDVYRKTNKAQQSIFSIGLYIALFPQLIAGPIVRYHDVAEQIKKRSQGLTLFASGVERFVFGLGKKMLIANPLGFVADSIFSLPANELTVLTAWLGIVCYALQIYFDFSGYSDMAIGLGRMFGFRFFENFNFPYIANSIRGFWQRWHISLSNWFRDYLYIPLGGNRKGSLITARNLFIVFLVCGLWHGASWNFIIWGLLHGTFLVLERGFWGGVLQRLPKIVQHSYVLLIVLTTWVFFRGETLDISVNYLSAMYSFADAWALHKKIAIQLDIEFYVTFIMALLLSTPIYQRLETGIKEKLLTQQLSSILYMLGSILLLSAIFILVIMEIAIGAYNPFIYFRF